MATFYTITLHPNPVTLTFNSPYVWALYTLTITVSGMGIGVECTGKVSDDVCMWYGEHSTLQWCSSGGIVGAQYTLGYSVDGGVIIQYIVGVE